MRASFMSVKDYHLSLLKKTFLGIFFAILASFSLIPTTPVYALPEDNPATTTETTAETTEETEKQEENCYDQTGAIGWIICPTTGVIAKAIDGIYSTIEDLLIVDPLSDDSGSPIHLVWEYFRGITNIVFIIFIMVIVYSQLTGLGINNYGIKKTLPRIIIAAILVNLSWIICSVAVDVSNIVGSSLRGVFTSIQEATISAGTISEAARVSWSELVAVLTGGGALAIGAITITSGLGNFLWAVAVVLLGALISIVTGLITIALRQAVVALLIMVSPLAFVAYLLPNTEKWFTKWKDLLTRMLVFYPTFSLLFGASQLAGWAIITSATNGFGVLLGMAVQIFPLFFSWTLMKMSGTFLGSINRALTGLAAKPQARFNKYADAQRERDRLRYFVNSNSGGAKLRRYIDYRAKLRDMETADLKSTYENIAKIRAINARTKYNGKDAQATSGKLKANRHTRIAKTAKNYDTAAKTAEADAEHVLNNYGDYYVNSEKDKKLLGKIHEAEIKRENTSALEAQLSNEDARLANTGAKGWLEYNRAQFTSVSDSEADFDFLVSSYLKAAQLGVDSAAYKHYITSATGGLGESRTASVLGSLIAKAAAVETRQRRDVGILLAKFPYDKRAFRNMVVGYYNDDDGFATDKNGASLGESFAGEFLANDPSKLVPWDMVDEHGPYCDLKDPNGNVITRIYKHDSPAMKEVFSNFDIPINDPINGLYSVLAGVNEGSVPGLEHVGLAKLQTTLGRAELSANFKEKNACFSPMVAEMVKKGYIQNYAQLSLAYLDSMNKATKPGNFNVQDYAAINLLNQILDPTKIEQAFPEELIRGFRNVNGEPIYGLAGLDENGQPLRDADGNVIKIPEEQATYEQILNNIKYKYVFPAGKKAASMMQRWTSSTADNQKPGTAKGWQKMREIFDTVWTGEDGIPNVYIQDGGDPLSNSREMRKKSQEATARYESGLEQPVHARRPNHLANIDAIRATTTDPEAFVRDVSNYLASYPETAMGADEIEEYFIDNPSSTIDELYDQIVDILAAFQD